MDVLLANAGVKFRNKHSRLSPPLGIAYIAAVLQTHGFSVSAQDFNCMTSDPSHVGAMLEQLSPRILGISVQTETYPNGLMLAEIAKQIDPAVTVIMGGPHATVMYSEILKEKDVDIVVRGEGEYTMLELAYCIIRNIGNIPCVSGIAFRQDGKICVTTDRPFITNPDEIPFPLRDLFPIPLYDQPGQVLMSRGGCPFNCCFCAVNNIWKGGRRFRSTENVMDEILYLHKTQGLNEINFADDTFTLNRNRVVDLCEQSVKIRDLFPWSWGCTTRVDLVDQKLIRLMSGAGCNAITFGVETGSQRVLDSIAKKITLKQVKNSVGTALESELSVLCSFMFPHPQDTAETIREQKQFMKELVGMGAQVSLAFTTPFPGTSYHEHMEDLGIRLLTNKWDEFDAKHLIIETKNLSRDKLEGLFQEMVQDIGLGHD